MKKRLILSLGILSILALTLVGCGKKNDEKVVFYNWGGLLKPEVLKKFTDETGIKVVYEEFDENEKMDAKVKNSPGVYDVIVPSEYMVEKMIKEGRLKEIDYSKLENFKNIGDAYKNKDYDPNNKYSIPMYYGTLGILYNKKKVDEADLKSWDILFNEKYKGQIWMLESSRDSLGVALWKLGYSANTKKMEELNQAKDLLIKQKPLVSGYLNDEIKQHMVNGNGALGVVYSTEAGDAVQENEDLGYYVPEKSNFWIDNLAILKDAPNHENALKLINFLLRPDIAAMSGDIMGTPNIPAREIEPAKSKADNKIMYPENSQLEKLEVYKNLGDFTEEFEQIWEDVKSH